MEQIPKVGALYCLYGEEPWLEISYRSVYPAVSRIYFFVSNLPWHGPASDQSRLLDAIGRLPDPEGKAELLRGDWTTEEEQRTVSAAIAANDQMLYSLIVDGDEVYDSNHLISMFQLAASDPSVGCWHVKWFTYWKALKFRINPLEPYDPPVLLRNGAGEFVRNRNIVAAKHRLIPPEICMCHHLSYVRSDEVMRAKHIMVPGHSHSAIAGWYENVWKRWDSDHSLTNLHPVNPPQYERAVQQPRDLLPPLLQPLWDQ
ncbi:MAG: hypothetical protein K1X83_12170 [Oligoflexia bacterium]|nr:hypothetical protein [Oligoflexia bacterium]